MANSPETQVKVYRVSDAPERALAGEAVAVLGYGNLGDDRVWMTCDSCGAGLSRPILRVDSSLLDQL
jgi:hypothetical protein